MSDSYTASFHNGGLVIDGIDKTGRKRNKLYEACREHNIRDPAYCDKQDHIIKGGKHEIWLDIPPKEAYEQIFGEAFREYNNKQTKKARKFESYWQKVKQAKTLVPVREALITVGNCDAMPDEETQKEIYKDFIERFKKMNPNMKVIGVYYHADEMRDDGKGGLIKGAPHIHLDYIPVAFNCDRGQKVQNSMNGALIEQGILNVEIDPEVAEKMYGLRKQKKASKKNADDISSRIECLPKLEDDEKNTGKKAVKTRVVTNLTQWTTIHRNLLMKVAREHGLTIKNPNENREHLSTEEYILYKDENLLGTVHALAEKLMSDMTETDEEKEKLIKQETKIADREKAADKKEEDFKKKVDEHNQEVQKKKDYLDQRETKARNKEHDIRAQERDLENKQIFFDDARKHVSASLHKFVSKLKKKKKELDVKEKNLDELLKDASEITDRVKRLKESTTQPYNNFADDIQFDEARLMASKGDGTGLCNWFNKLGHKFGGWLQKAQYFAKNFWNKTPDELKVVAEDMQQSYCRNLGEYLEKGMKGSTQKQIQETREIQEDISKVENRKLQRKGISWER